MGKIKGYLFIKWGGRKEAGKDEDVGSAGRRKIVW